MQAELSPHPAVALDRPALEMRGIGKRFPGVIALDDVDLKLMPGKVHALMIPDAKSATLMGLIRKSIKPDSIVYTDSFHSYDVLDVSEFHHVRVNHSQTFVARRGHHINGIENFWNQSKRHLRRYNGIPRKHFHLFLKECEWRFNYRPATNLFKVLANWARQDLL